MYRLTFLLQECLSRLLPDHFDCLAEQSPGVLKESCEVDAVASDRVAAGRAAELQVM